MEDTTQDVYDAIVTHIEMHQRPPTQREIAEACHISKTVVRQHLDYLVAWGKIEVKSGIARGIRLIDA